MGGTATEDLALKRPGSEKKELALSRAGFEERAALWEYIGREPSFLPVQRFSHLYPILST
jgi:hypothetical protein